MVLKSCTHAHNFYLETLAELGVVGFVNILLLFVVPVLLFFKKRPNKPIKFYLILSIVGFIILNSF